MEKIVAAVSRRSFFHPILRRDAVATARLVYHCDSPKTKTPLANYQDLQLLYETELNHDRFQKS